MKGKIHLISIILLFMASFVFSQTMNIHTKDGNVHAFNLMEIDSITFNVANNEIPTEGLVAYYPFNGNANDESGDGNDGTLLGNATITDVLILGDNNEDAASLPYTIINGLKDFTFSALIKIHNFHNSGSRYPQNTWISATSNIHPYGNGFILFYSTNLKSWSINIYPIQKTFDIDSTIEDNKWHHIVITRIDSLCNLFIDGIQIGKEIVVNDSALVVDNNGFIIGQEQDIVGDGFEAAQSLAGEIDNLRIYNRALTKTEILGLYNNERR